MSVIQWVLDNAQTLMLILGSLVTGGFITNKVQTRKDRQSLFAESQRQIKKLQDDQQKFWIELQTIRLERDAFERELKAVHAEAQGLREENKKLQASVRRLREKLNKYIKSDSPDDDDD